MRESVSLFLGVGVVACAGSLASAQYIVGETWDRMSAWTTGVHGTLINNPSPDHAGNGVWSYEYVKGSGLTSANPWFAEATTPMTWDNSWWKTGLGVWSRGNNFSPPVMPERLIHTLSPKSANTMPLVRWTSPIADPAYVGVSGDLTIGWQGFNGTGYESTVEVVIALVSGSTGAVTPLYTTTLTKPTSAPVKEFVTLPIALGGIHVDLGDSIIFTHRAKAESIPAGWVSMYDNVDVTLSQIPAPAAGLLGAIAGLALVRRRR